MSTFLEIQCDAGHPHRYAVLPVPYEGTVSYKPGTAAGPAAILEASEHIELFDGELRREIHTPGIRTYPAVPAAHDPAEQMRRIRAAAEPLVDAGKFVLALGGEHSITAPLVQAYHEHCDGLSVLQIDAHADLRDTYGGTPHSHACVMRRVLELTDRVAQVGIRSFSGEELDACGSQVARFITPQVVRAEPDWIDRALALLADPVYVTVDMDGLDPSIAPGVGTPEPGGLTWQEVTDLLRCVCRERRVVGADIVETRPIPPNHITEAAAARLAAKFIAWTSVP